MRALSSIATVSLVSNTNVVELLKALTFETADYLIQSGLAKQIRFHGKRFAWFVSDVTKKDWDWLLNTMVYGELFKNASETERESLRRLGLRWKVRLAIVSYSGLGYLLYF